MQQQERETGLACALLSALRNNVMFTADVFLLISFAIVVYGKACCFPSSPFSVSSTTERKQVNGTLMAPAMQSLFL